MIDKLLKKEEKIALVGLGYVGLPIALEFARKMSVIGFDIREDRVEMMKNKIDPSKELPGEAFDGTDIFFTSSPEDLAKAKFYIVAVPTPIDDYNMPDLKPVLKASETVGKVLKPGDYVVYESTVYPGCTEEDCVPLLEKISGLKYKQDFKVGFSPERINPGDKKHTLTKIVKVSSGCDEESAEIIAQVYEQIIEAGVHRASSIKVAEAAKIIENTQRDINIAFMNELSIIFNKMKINTFDVLEAAGTKWNFLNFFPGLVGGHCIGVDPYYLSYKAKKLGYHAQIINAGRFINDSMGGYIAKQTVKKIIRANKILNGAKVLVMGITFKENVSDIRNSRVVDVISELASYGVNVDVVDPYADPAEVKEEYNIDLLNKPNQEYDCAIVAVNHKEYVSLDEGYFKSLLIDPGVLVDIKGIYKEKIKKLIYWSL
jgi:UDP-N-acetyl-D-galactosamine dehydrogenase